MKYIALAFALMLPVSAMADKADTVNQVWHVTAAGSADLLSGVACNAAAASRTVERTLSSGQARIELSVFFTYNAATVVTLTPYCSRDGTQYAQYTTRSCSSGACTVYPQTDAVTTSAADFDYKIPYDVAPCKKFKVVVSCTGGGASDLFDVQAVSLTGGE